MFYCFLSAIYFMLEWLKVLHWKRSNTGRQKLFSISFFFQYFDVLPAIDFTLVWHNRDSRQGPPLAPGQPNLFSKRRILHFSSCSISQIWSRLYLCNSTKCVSHHHTTIFLHLHLVNLTYFQNKSFRFCLRHSWKEKNSAMD